LLAVDVIGAQSSSDVVELGPQNGLRLFSFARRALMSLNFTLYTVYQLYTITTSITSETLRRAVVPISISDPT
jgi:hypothetical protein